MFDFITDISIAKGTENEVIDSMIANRTEDTEQVEGAFAEMFIPRTLAEFSMCN